MKTFILTLSLVLSLLPLSPFKGDPVDSLSVKLSTSAPREGVIRLAIFESPAALENEVPSFSKVFELSEAQLPLNSVLTDLPSGSFAIAAYHDLDNDGKLNRNLFGVPTEPYAFSGRLESKWRAPKWEEIVLTRETREKTIRLDLRYWKEM